MGLVGAFTPFTFQGLGGVGASGAVCGVVGLMVVRFYFKSQTVPLWLAPLPIFLRLRVNVFAIATIYVSWDLQWMLSSELSEVNYWAHLMGTACGIYLGVRLGLHKKGVEQRHQELAVNNQLASGMGGNVKAMNRVLEINAENTEVLLAKARHLTPKMGYGVSAQRRRDSALQTCRRSSSES